MNSQPMEIRMTWTKHGRRRAAARAGFTLTELLVVITIIGIIIVFLLNAAADSVRTSELRATQSLIAKLESALNDRLDALMQNAPTPNYAHGYLAGVFAGTSDPIYPSELWMIPSTLIYPPPGQSASGLPNPKCNTLQRAQVIATYDYIKAEMPDVFFVDPTVISSGTLNEAYPIRFTGLPYPGAPLNNPRGQYTQASAGNYILPMGHMVQGPRNLLPNPTVPTDPYPWTTDYGDSHLDSNPQTLNNLISTHPELGYTGSGINGASYAVAAGLYKNLGYPPAAYDMQDNDGNGLVDDWQEVVIYGGNAQQIVTNIKNHTHNTARAEMLYALLVEGSGPFGSVLNRDDFTDKEVKDTDNDGLPEFVDAWGQPLQFFRWPILYHSDIQRGQTVLSPTDLSNPNQGSFNLAPPYATRVPLVNNEYEQREQDPLDPNQQLVAPGWYARSAGSLAANGNSPFTVNPPIAVPAGVSASAQFFSTFFHRLTEPFVPANGSPYYNPATGLPYYGVDWDRSGKGRCAFFTKFLVLSGGPDLAPGVFLYPDQYLNSLPSNDSISAHLIANENSAMPFGWAAPQSPDVDFIQSATIGVTLPIASNAPGNPAYPTTYEVMQAAQDDITNQNLQATGGIGGSR